MRERCLNVAPLLVALSVAACSHAPSVVLPFTHGDTEMPYMRGGAALRALDQTGAGKITHVVYIVQENRSFNNLFIGYPGATTATKAKNSEGKTVTLQPHSMKDPFEIDHSAEAMFLACDGTGRLPGTDCRMDGFDKEAQFFGPRNGQFTYAPRNETKPYWDMAHQYVLADQMFQSQLDESFIAHQYVIAAQAAWSVNLPMGAWGCQGGKHDTIHTITKDRNAFGPKIQACYDYQTLGDELDKAKLSWRFYASEYGSKGNGGGAMWSSYQAVRHIRYGPDWKKDVVSPNWTFITDVRAGKLANFTWITPVCDDSDHIDCGGGYGPSWVSALVNTVGKSKFWDSTAIFVQWDDWGGLYDPVPPPFEGRDSLGFRVPLLVISPYARKDRVSHVQYETASVLRFAEDLFGLGQLADADKRATSPAKDCFDFSRKPRPFVKIKAPKPPGFFMQHFPNDYFAPDNQ
jgi:phospholipase C